MQTTKKIYVAGHNGMVGSAIVRKLKAEGYDNLVLRSSKELDLRDQAAVNAFFKAEKPDYVFLAAAKVGGIVANNTYRADFLYDNLMIEANVIHAAYIHKVIKLLFLGSSCIYPKFAPQPMKEEDLLTGILESTNEPYAIAKIAGIKLCENYRRQYGCDFISAMPTNLYGPGDNYDLEKSHVIPALIRKMHLGKCLEQKNWEALRKDLNRLPIEGIGGESDEADILTKLIKFGITQNTNNLTTQPANTPTRQHANTSTTQVTLWGTGAPLREFMHVDDLATACFFLMQHYSEEQFVNIGSGQEVSIKELALMIKDIVGFNGDLVFDATKPDGTPRKLMDSGKLMGMGFNTKITLLKGLKTVYINNF
ncbi:MAG: GDP-L-fucose synthase [Saprospiraceae bacterium]|nr:GDP-L-fucose synthase [Saprospiraceae bacterium]